MMQVKNFELAAKSLVQKKLWSFGYKVKRVRFSPVDFIVNEKYKVKVILYSTKEKFLEIPADSKYADVLAVVVSVPFTTAMLFFLRLGFSNTEPMVGKRYKIGTEGDLIEKDFVASPKNAFIGPSKEQVVPQGTPGLVAEEWYSVHEIAQYQLMGRQMGSKNIRKLIESGQMRASQWGKGNGKRTMVKGEWIIQYLAI